MNKLILVCVLFLLSCEKDIDFKLNEMPDVLVVDGAIENDKPPVVILTKSFSFYSKIDPSLLSNAFVHNAEVFVSNGVLTHKLKEYSYTLAPGFTGWFYSIDSSDLSTAFTGELNTSYDLRILSNGQEYTSSVKIPSLNTYPDSIWFQQAPLNPDTNKRVFFIRATDPPGLGNYVRYFTKKNSGVFLPGENSVYDDQVIDGTTYSVILPQGINKNDPPKADSNFYSKGDTVTLKFCNIERSVYKFWSSWEFAQQSIGNPFAQPNSVFGNISNGALGVFCGYAAWYRTKVAE